MAKPTEPKLDELVRVAANELDQMFRQKHTMADVEWLLKKFERESRDLYVSGDDSELRRALRFYARQYHAAMDPEWESEEGWLCPPNDESWMVEDGGVARAALTGERIEWEGEDENTPIEGEKPSPGISNSPTKEKS